MANEDDGTAPAMWDPTANGGAGGWVHRHDRGPRPLPRRTARSQPAPPHPPTAADHPRVHAWGARQRPALPPSPAPAPAASPSPSSFPRSDDPPAPAYRPAGWRTWAGAVVAGLLAAAVAIGVIEWVSDDGGRDRTATGPSAGPSGTVPVAGRGGGGGPQTGRPPTASEATPGTSSQTVRAQRTRAQAIAVDDLLKDSADDRQKVIDAVGAVKACSSPESVAAAGDALTDAAHGREGLLARLAVLQVDQLDGGEEAATKLRSAWQHSADADAAFAAWADAMAAGGCTPGKAPKDSDYDRGEASSVQASKAKEDFVDTWHPIASAYGLATRSADAI